MPSWRSAARTATGGCYGSPLSGSFGSSCGRCMTESTSFCAIMALRNDLTAVCRLSCEFSNRSLLENSVSASPHIKYHCTLRIFPLEVLPKPTVIIDHALAAGLCESNAMAVDVLSGRLAAISLFEHKWHRNKRNDGSGELLSAALHFGRASIFFTPSVAAGLFAGESTL